MQIIKKDLRTEEFDFEKIKKAVSKSAARISFHISEQQWNWLKEEILNNLNNLHTTQIPVYELHSIVESSLFKVMIPVAQQYANYRNYKKDYVEMMEDTLKTADDLNYHADRSNANTTAGLISTKRSLIYTAFNKNLYKKVFLSEEEYKAIKDGYIYIHDLGARMDTYNCCLFDMGRVLQGGFEWEHIGYNEPKDVRTACNLISDITLNCAAQQYGGFTIPEIDSILAPYARKSYNHYFNEYLDIAHAWFTEVEGNRECDKCAHEYAMEKVERDICQGFQGFEHTFNTVASSRGDYPFVTMSGGCEEDPFGQLVWHCALKVRREGQGHPGKKRPAIFPKLVFIYTEKLHSKGKKMHHLFLEGVQTSAVAMYPDWLSMDKPEGVKSALADIFAKYHKFGISRWLLDEDNNVYENPEWFDAIVSPMGCRAYLSPIYQSGKLTPVDENDRPIFHGRFNGGAVSLNLPMIYYKAATAESHGTKPVEEIFFNLLKYYCDMIDKIHIKTYEFLCKLKASCNPVAFCEGGFGQLGFNDEIKPLVDRITFSYGFTALHELQMLATGESLYQVRNNSDAIAWKAEQFINNYVNGKKKEREEGKVPYIAAIYATPAESLCGTQLNQFRDMYGVIPGVSDKAYFTNSFHMWVGEDITPWEKQDAEFKFFHESSGGHIQYCRFASGMNTEYIAATIERAMKLGYYFGVNIEKSYCGDCGTEVEDGIDTCPHCGGHDITTINRVCGYLGYSRVAGTSKMNDAKLAEIADRKSM